MARPTSYKPEYAEQGRKLCLLGATDDDLAEFFGVSQKTINTWKKQFPEFLQSLKSGKGVADAEVASSLYKRATGYEFDEIEIRGTDEKKTIRKTKKHIAPDTVAAIFWLKNRQKGKWRDKNEIEHSGNVSKTISELMDDLSQE